MNRLGRCANARSSTTLPSVPLNRLVMTEMTSETGDSSGFRGWNDLLRRGSRAARGPAERTLEARRGGAVVSHHEMSPGCGRGLFAKDAHAPSS